MIWIDGTSGKVALSLPYFTDINDQGLNLAHGKSVRIISLGACQLPRRLS